MSFFGSMDIATSGMTAQRLRLDVISQNLANVDTTRTPEGGPYRRKDVLFENVLATTQSGQKKNTVRVSAIVEDEGEFPVIYDPTHPDADENGYVQKPNVNSVDEMVNMISASRSYEANITAFNTMKAMTNKALEIGRG